MRLNDKKWINVRNIDNCLWLLTMVDCVPVFIVGKYFFSFDALTMLLYSRRLVFWPQAWIFEVRRQIEFQWNRLNLTAKRDNSILVEVVRKLSDRNRSFICLVWQIVRWNQIWLNSIFCLNKLWHNAWFQLLKQLSKVLVNPLCRLSNKTS